jgi:hypothetical protein
VLKLIRVYLESGVMADGVKQPTRSASREANRFTRRESPDADPHVRWCGGAGNKAPFLPNQAGLSTRAPIGARVETAHVICRENAGRFAKGPLIKEIS